MSQDVGLEYFRMGEMVKTGQCAGEYQVGKPFEFYLLKYSFEVRALLASTRKYCFPR